MCGRHHLRAWELGIGQHLVERDLGKVRKEQEQAAHLRSERALGQVELSGVGHVRSIGSSRCGPFVVSPSRETSESLLLENRRDRGRTQLFPTLIQGIPDVVHRRVLLAQGDDLLTKSLPGRRQLGLLRLWQKELSLRVFAELMAQDAKTPGCVAEPLGRLC